MVFTCELYGNFLQKKGIVITIMRKGEWMTMYKHS